jgi:hypothetical protein
MVGSGMLTVFGGPVPGGIGDRRGQSLRHSARRQWRQSAGVVKEDTHRDKIEEKQKEESNKGLDTNSAQSCPEAHKLTDLGWEIF